MPAVLLLAAIAAEIAATTSMKLSHGFTRLWPTVATGVGYVVSFTLLAQALRTLPISLAYAVWSGVGTAVVAGIGVLFFNERIDAAKAAGLVLIIAGVVLLNLRGAAH